MSTLAAAYGYTKIEKKQRRKLLQTKTDYRHLMMRSALKLVKSTVMATKQRG